MPRRNAREVKAEAAFTDLGIRVDAYEAAVEASVNHAVYQPETSWLSEEDDPLYQFDAQLTLSGVCVYPDGRVGDSYELTIYGRDLPSQRLRMTLRDAQARDKGGMPQYRSYRGREVPVYVKPKGVGHLSKIRGEPCWTGWLFVLPGFVSDAMALLGHDRPLYIALRERRKQRRRWIERLSLQTNDPAEE